MAAGLIVPVSGPYVGTWNANALGTLNDDGYELQCTLQGQEVAESDAYGMTLVETIYRGQNWRIRLRALEWDKLGLLDILEMFGSAVGGDPSPILGPVGDRWTAYCNTLLLTAILGNPPTVPQTLTAASCGFAPNSQSAMLMTSKVRELPLELVLFPYSTVIQGVTVQVPFTTT